MNTIGKNNAFDKLHILYQWSYFLLLSFTGCIFWWIEIQVVEMTIFLEKSVDKWKQVWYYNQAVARKNVSDRVQKKDSKKSKKTLDKQETVWYNNQVAERKKFRWKSTKDLEN